MNFEIPRLVLLELHFRALLDINKLPHYHGAQWSALFRNVLRNFLPVGLDMSAAGIFIQPFEAGVLRYKQNDPIHLGVVFPFEQHTLMERLLAGFNDQKVEDGHFQPGKTIKLESIYCRVSDKIWQPDRKVFLTEKILTPEIEKLTALDEFHLHFYTPLRDKRPEGFKEEGHTFCDEDFFLMEDSYLPARHLFSKIRCADLPDFDNIDLQVKETGLTWLDMTYGSKKLKTIGGVAGRVKFKGKLTQETARVVVAGQYTGVGKNGAFGFGFYNIPELIEVSRIRRFNRGSTLFGQALSLPALQAALSKMTNSSPGPDGITLEDIKKTADTVLPAILNEVKSGVFKYGDFKKYRMKKENGGFREICIQNYSARLIQKAAADYLAPIIEQLLSTSSYAYRRGLNRKGAASALKKALQDGYCTGVKADIAAFFDSISITVIGDILRGLFPFEPLIEQLNKSLRTLRKNGVKGLAQGSPLSPLLSNLYLDKFDRAMAEVDCRFIRYADDFVVLFKDDQKTEKSIEQIRAFLDRLQLHLKEDKTVEVKQGKPIQFLGFIITESEIIEKQKTEKQEGAWPPVFKEGWIKGSPVYLTSVCRGAFSNGTNLVVQFENDEKEEINWSAINRIIVVGRSSFSGGVVYRAVKENIPITFIDVMGKVHGRLFPEQYDLISFEDQQRKFKKNKKSVLEFSKEIIASKIHNSYVLLQRNSVVSKQLKEIEDSVQSTKKIESLRGYEGTAAKIYFSELAKLVNPFEFKGRIYHPPDSPVNVMLSFGYTLLYNRLATALEDKGFNSRIGFMHDGRGRHAALASDLLEQVRFIAERIVLSLIHLREIKPGNFSMEGRKGSKYCRMDGDGFRKFIRRYEKTMGQQFMYDGKNKMSYNSYMDEMADNLRRTLKLNTPYSALRIR